jgi:hypothetical protein
MWTPRWIRGIETPLFNLMRLDNEREVADIVDLGRKSIRNSTVLEIGGVLSEG